MKSLKTTKRKKAAEGGKSNHVVKAHASTAGTPRLAKRPNLQDTPTAPVKKPRTAAVTPGLEDIAPKVSHHLPKSSPANPVSDSTDEDEGSATFVSFQPRTTVGLTSETDYNDDVSEFSFSDIEWDAKMEGLTEEQINEHNKVVQKMEDYKSKCERLSRQLDNEKKASMQQLENQGRAVMEAETRVEALEKTLSNLKCGKNTKDLKEQIKSLAKSLGKAKSECETHKKNNLEFAKSEKGFLKRIEDYEAKLNSKSPSQQKNEEELQRLRQQNELWTTKLNQLTSKQGGDVAKEALLELKNVQEMYDKLVAQSNSWNAEKQKLEKSLQDGRRLVKELEETTAKMQEENKNLLADVKRLETSLSKAEAKDDSSVTSDTSSASSQVRALKTANEELVGEKTRLNRELDALKRELRQARRSNPDSASVTQSEADLTPDERDRATLVKENRTLQSLNQKLTDQLKLCTQALKDNGKFLKSERSESAKKKIKNFIVGTVYHTTKFIPTPAKLNEMCEQVYHGIKADPELGWDAGPEHETHLPLSEFLRIYSGTCREKMNNCRQYNQTCCLNASIGTFYTNYVSCCLTGTNQ